MEEWQDLRSIWRETLNWKPTDEQEHKLEKLYHLIITGNQQLNLTRITQPLDFWEKHLWDSLAPIFYQPKFSKINQLKGIDIGTGSGFPGIPLAIIFPDWKITLLDSTRKKINFLEGLSLGLNLDKIKTVIDRAEALGHSQNHRNCYDLALIRAVADVSVCAEYTIPFLKIGGLALLYRGQWTENEEKKLNSALIKLGGKIANIHPYQTPLTHSIRHCIYVEKISKTPQEFPRAVGIPSQKPL